MTNSTEFPHSNVNVSIDSTSSEAWYTLDVLSGGGVGSSYTVTLPSSYSFNNNIIWDNKVSVGDNQLSQNGLTLDGNSDIHIGDQSLKDFMNKVEQRLAILTVNPKLEQDWEELKRLGDEYRRLEQEIVDKIKVWDILKNEHYPPQR